MSDSTLYFVTDIEADGPSALLNSMLSFATVVINTDGEVLGEYEAVLKPRSGKVANERTMAWWRTQPEAWSAVTTDPEDPKIAMQRFVSWVETFDGTRIFAARPLLFDGQWIDAYLQEFCGTRIFDGPYDGRQIFHGAGLDIPSYLNGLFGHTHLLSTYVNIPQEWLGEHAHTHKAIDDARGYAHLLAQLFEVARQMKPHPSDFTGSKSC